MRSLPDVAQSTTFDNISEVEVEGFEGFGGVDGGAAQPQLQLFLVPTSDLVFEQPREKRDVGPLVVDGLAIAGFEGLQNSRQAQSLKLWGELVHQFHDSSPNKPPTNSTALRTKVRAGGAGTGSPGGGWASSPSARMRLMVL